ncbi:MAG: polymer-forming cytoskeletal protein [Myxococcota bacterium]
MSGQDSRKGRDDLSTGTRGTSAGMGQLNAFIDQGSEFSGRLSFRDTVRIDGRFEGEISSDNTLIVGETGHIQATIHSQTVVISGEIEGDIEAPRQVVIHKMARVNGNIRTGNLSVEEGAQVNGQITMTGAAASTRAEARTDPAKHDRKKTNGADRQTTLGASPE